MKRCPQCNSTYTDESLSFCLADGAELEEEDAAVTETYSALESDESLSKLTRQDRVDIRIPQPSEEKPAEITAGTTSKGMSGWLVASILAILAVLVIAIAGLGIYVFLLLPSRDQAGPANQDGNRNAEIERLKERIEELGSQIEDELPVEDDETTPDDDGSDATPEEEDPEYDEEVIQRVNSPVDGFLALRDRPSATEGERIAKIPHDDIVVLERCLEKSETIGGRSGHWCRVTWEDLSGWVFDAWLID